MDPIYQDCSAVAFVFAGDRPPQVRLAAVVDCSGSDDSVITLALPHSADVYWLWARHGRLLPVYIFPSKPAIYLFLCPASDPAMQGLLVPGRGKNFAALVVPLQIV